MKRLILIICILAQCVLMPVVAQEDTSKKNASRPRIGVVLAGGGAKGVSHVAALKAIEEAGLPIDLVVGTSIGSIVGGLYCTGYSPDTMRQIIRSTDWIKMIMDNPDFGDSRLSTKKNIENYILSFSLDPNRLKSGTGFGGVLQGRNVLRFFQDLTRYLPDSLDFEDMPIPFACVGTNAVDGTCKVFTSGNVPLAMRASMAIPTAFTPVTIDSVVYVDGGVVDNLPVDVARQLGADIVIAVDLVTKTTNEQLTNSAIDMLLHCVDLYSQERYKKNIADANIYIPIDVTGYSAASFSPVALDTLMARGEHYVSLKKYALDSLRQTMMLAEEPIRIRVGDYSFAKNAWEEDEKGKQALAQANGGSMYSAVRLGARYDDQEYASVIAQANLVLSQKNRSLLSFQGRLGQRMEGTMTYSQRTFGTQRLGFYYKYKKQIVDLEDKGNRMFDAKLRLHKLNLYLTQEWRRVKYTFGVNYNIYLYRDILLGSYLASRLDEWPDTDQEKFFSYFLKTEVNTLNRQYFPTSGHYLEFNVDLITDNLITYEHKAMLPIFNAKWSSAIPCSKRITLQPHLYARIMVTEDIAEPIALMNMAGGLYSGQHFMHQTTMAGVNDPQIINTDGMAIAGLTLQTQTWKNQYIVLTGDVMSYTSHIHNALKRESLTWGAEASYNYRSPIGPLTLKCYWSDLTKEFDINLNLGYYF